MLLIIKIALTFFVLGFMCIGLIGATFFFQLVQKLNSTIRTMLYTEIIIIVLVTLCMDLSYRGIPILAFYGMTFIIIGFCSVPIRIFMGDYLWKPKIK
jgi:hypothetical protein